MPSNAAASTTTSSTPASSGRSRSYASESPTPRRGWPARSQRRRRRCALWTSTNHLASPRPSIGPRRSSPSARGSSTSNSSRQPWAPFSSTARTSRGPPTPASPRSSAGWVGWGEMAEGEIQTPPMLDAAVAFGRILRGAGLRAGTDRLVEFARAMDELDASRRDDVYWAGRVTLVSRPEDLEVYDRAFELFWEAGGGAKPRLQPKVRFSVPQPDNSVMPPKKTVEKDEGGEDAVKLRYSPVEVLRRKDFALYSQEEFAELQRLLADLRLSGALRRSRRLEPAPRGRHDPRRTLRSAMRTGGEAR